VLTLPEEGPPPKDRRRQFLFSPIGRVAASLRHGHWNDLSAPVEAFTIDKLLSVVQSFGGAPIYGAEFIDCERYFAQWSERLSLDLVCDSSAMEHSIQLFQEGAGPNRILDIRLWFRDLRIRDASGSEIALDEFPAPMREYIRGLDSDRDGKITKADWDKMQERLSKSQNLPAAWRRIRAVSVCTAGIRVAGKVDEGDRQQETGPRIPEELLLRQHRARSA